MTDPRHISDVLNTALRELRVSDHEIRMVPEPPKPTPHPNPEPWQRFNICDTATNDTKIKIRLHPTNP